VIPQIRNSLSIAGVPKQELVPTEGHRYLGTSLQAPREKIKIKINRTNKKTKAK
jgi:hypothetical protein